jgi:outer membrane beta-barrel protein
MWVQALVRFELVKWASRHLSSFILHLPVGLAIGFCLTVGTASAAKEAEPTPQQERRLIKVLQKKSFLKKGRFELSPTLGAVTNDPFVNRYLASVGLGYHISEVLSVELNGTWSPDFGDGDWKPITRQLVEENKVAPDISKIYAYGTLSLQFTPIHGKVAIAGDKIIMLDVFGSIGGGVVHTRDLEIFDHDIGLSPSVVQNHPATAFGGGLRVIFGRHFAMRMQGDSLIYIETIEETTLEMKNNFTVKFGASLFFP